MLSVIKTNLLKFVTKKLHLLFCSFRKNKIVGVVTSGAFGFRINKSLAFAYVNSDLAKEETELYIEIQGQKRKAKILNSPAYDPENKKLKS